MCAGILAASGPPAVASDGDSPDFKMSTMVKSLRHCLGSMRGSYLNPGARVSDQILESMGIPNKTTRLPDGNFLLSGCRVHSCDEKSAIIATPEGAVVAAGLIHFQCHMARRGIVDCADAPHLTLFVKPNSDRDVLSGELESWARREAVIAVIETRRLR